MQSVSNSTRYDDLGLAFHHAPVPMLLCDGASLCLLDANARASRDYHCRTGAFDGASLLSLYAAEHHTQIRTIVERALCDGAAALDGIQPGRRGAPPAHGHTACYRAVIDGAPPAVLLVLDRSPAPDEELRRLRGELLQTRADLRHAQEIAHLGIWAADVRTGIVETTSPEIWRIFRMPEDMQPIRIEDLFRRIHPADLDRVVQQLDRALAVPGRGYDCRYRVQHEDGEIRHVHSLADVTRDEAGRAARIVGVSQDVTDIHLAHEQIQRLAFFDDTTGLPNRVAMCQQLASASGAGQMQPLAVLAIELAGFRQINLTLGHLNGDALLRAVGQRIAGVLDQDTHLSRTGNAQFTALLRGAAAETALQFAEAIAQAFKSTFLIAGVQYEIGAHVGIATAIAPVSDSASLARQADVAVFQARQYGQSAMEYVLAKDPSDPKRLAMLGEFRQALGDGQIELYCQPKVEMATGKVTGAEALVRWRHPTLGIVSPSEFLPLIESTELIHALTTHMLEASVRQAYEWRQQGLLLPIAVNLSTRNLNVGSLALELQALLARWGGTPDWIGLEITESSLIVNPCVSIAELHTLSRLGFRLFIDDFGTGYSSLSYLTTLPVDVIKIDHGFTTTMLDDKRAAAIVKATIDLAHDLGMSVVAEGTSSRDIWDALLAFGCDEAQGFYIAPPLPSRDVAEWVRNHDRRSQ